MQLIVVWVSKVVYLLLRMGGRRGSALPGLIVEKLCPGYLTKALSILPKGVIIVTGTNGKTTSTKMLVHIARANYRVLTNPTGSNFTRGIVATVIHNSDIFGRLSNYDIGIFELDEAYAARFVDYFKPRGLVVTNIMRDQMDRFGEIDNTAKIIQKVVKKTTEFIVLNRDDPRVINLANHTNKQIYYFGVSPALRPMYINDDELYGDLKEQPNHSLPKATTELLSIVDSDRIIIDFNGHSSTIKMRTNSTFNYQNAVAVCAAGLAIGINEEVIIDKLSEVGPAFGRGELIKIGSKTIILQLVKNPGGFRHALHSLNHKKIKTIVIAINDDYADGRDVSWLWDVSLTDKLNKVDNRYAILTSGSRATDMALRLKYDNINVDFIEPALDRCLAKALEITQDGDSLMVYTTYTAMLSLRKIISRNTEVETV